MRFKTCICRAKHGMDDILKGNIESLKKKLLKKKGVGKLKQNETK